MNHANVSTTAAVRPLDLALLLFISFALTMTLSMIDSGLPSNGATAPATCEYLNSNDALSQEIRLVNWNTAKVSLTDAINSLEETEVNLLALQEAPDDDSLLFSPGHSGLITTGVGLSSEASPSRICRWQSLEPIMLTPKAAIAATFPISGTTKELLVINLHGVNFSWLLGTWKTQIQAAATLAKSHDGPVIFVGDLNTWRFERVRSINEIAAEIGLQTPDYQVDNRTAPFGYPLDWLLSRGIEWQQVNAPQRDLSDHNPIIATGLIKIDKDSE
jgi:endonuclease/exonuclease/phosphatase (EEP) superfamily protein YafD